MVAVGDADEVACGAMETVGGVWMAEDDDCDWSWVGQIVPVDDWDGGMVVVG